MDLQRTEYPAMLERLQPLEAAAKFKARVHTVGKFNADLADWFLERRKIEDDYAAKLRKLVRRPAPLQDATGTSNLGIFDAPWKKVLVSTDEIAQSHATFAKNIETDIELKLRNFVSSNKEFSSINTVQVNLGNIAKELEDAQEKLNKLNSKKGKASSAKVDVASKNLQNANGQWNTQAPFMFEKLQEVDERRCNHLRDVLTQYETMQADELERSRVAVEQALNLVLEIDTTQEILEWQKATISGKPITERSARQLSTAGSTSTAAPSALVAPTSPVPRSSHNDASSERNSEHSGRLKPVEESKMKRFGTMLNRRRQSIQGAPPGFARASSPSKEGRFPGIGFGRTPSRDGARPGPSPRASSGNLRSGDSPGPDNRLSALPEQPSPTSPAHTNGVAPNSISENLASPSTVNGTELPDLSDVQPPPGPPPSHLKADAEKDAEGFTVPSAMNDPISQAQLEAQEGDQPHFTLDIRKEPIPEQDADAAAALSAVTNTLRSAAVTPGRKVGTVRGRRDVRNTIYAPAGSLDIASMPEQPMPPSPGVANSRAATLSSLSGHQFAPPASDTTSIRSGHSLTNNIVTKHTDMHEPGLNASIIETVNVTFENGGITSTKITGEIALVYNNSDATDISSAATATVRINNFPNLEAIGPNRTFIHPLSDENSDEYKVDLSAISPKLATAFTYKVHTPEENLSAKSPLLLKLAWKPQGDKLGLVIEYALNPAFGSSASFHNLIILAFSTGPRSTGCQTKPSGTQYKEKSLVVWRLGDLTLTPDWHKIICRLNGADGAAPAPGHVEARWELTGSAAAGSGISLSTLEASKGKEKQVEDDPFADEDAIAAAAAEEPATRWVEMDARRKLVAGRYEARVVDAEQV